MSNAYNFTALQTQSPYIPGNVITVGGYFALTQALGNGDTITFANAIPPSGVTAIEVLVYHPQLDTNASPTGAYEVGDSLSDGNAAARYLTGAVMGTNQTGAQIHNFSNVVPTISSGAYTKGVGYTYTSDENTSTNEANGYLDLVLTVTAGPATGAASGTIWIYFTYKCVGNI